MTPHLLLSRTLALDDYTHLDAEVAQVANYVTTDDPPHRHWEYALALHAIERWLDADEIGHRLRAPIYDVGPDARIWTNEVKVALIDPPESTLATVDLTGLPLASVVTSFRTVTRVVDLDAFLYRLSCLVAPGGLVVLTMEFWDRCGKDLAMGHTTRQRIFCPKTYGQLRNLCAPLHLLTFGGVDPSYHGRQLHDYSLASLVLEKRA